MMIGSVCSSNGNLLNSIWALNGRPPGTARRSGPVRVNRCGGPSDVAGSTAFTKTTSEAPAVLAGYFNHTKKSATNVWPAASSSVISLMLKPVVTTRWIVYT